MDQIEHNRIRKLIVNEERLKRQQDLYNEVVTSAGNYSDLVNACIAAEEEVTKIEQFMDIQGVLMDSHEFEDDPDELQKHLQIWNDYEDNLVAAQEFLKTCQFNKKNLV